MDAPARRARLLRLLFGGRPTRWGLLVPVVAALAGLLFATSAVTSQGRSLRASDTRDLADVVASRGDDIARREQAVADLREEVRSLGEAESPDGSQADRLSARAADLARTTGTEAVRGSGVEVTLTDSQRPLESFDGEFSPDDLVIHQQDVQAVVNALWRGGAEAMMIQDQRIISTSAVRCVGNTLILQNRVYSPPFTIKAIGDTQGMRKALDDDESIDIIEQYVAAVGLGYDVRTTPDLSFPAYDGSLTLQHATVAK